MTQGNTISSVALYDHEVRQTVKILLRVWMAYSTKFFSVLEVSAQLQNYILLLISLLSFKKK